MTKQEKLEALKNAQKGVKLMMTEAVKNVYRDEMLPIVQATTTFKVKMENDENVGWCEVAFDLGDWKKEFGLDFTIYLKGEYIDLSHGFLSGATLGQRPYLIERDKVIAKLWDKEEEIKAVFRNVKKAQDEMIDTYNALDREIWAIEDEIAQEERKHYLDMLKVGSKWIYKWETEIENHIKRPMTIDKITPKLVFYHQTYSSYGGNSTRMKITDMVRNLKNGSIIKYEEEQV